MIKKILFPIILVVMMVSTAVLSVQAVDTTNAVITAVIENKVKPGTDFDVAINIENNPGVAMLKLKVGYDANYLTLVSNTASSEVFTNTPTVNDTKNPCVYVVCDPTNATANGTLFTFTFNTEKTCPDGVYPITVEVVEAYDQNGDDVSISGMDGAVTIRAILPGDVNADERINGKDLLLLTQYIAEMDVTIDVDGADTNADGRINGKDLLLLTQYIAEMDVTLGKQ